MKIKLKQTIVYEREVDIDAEISRINEAFKGKKEVIKRQLEIVEALISEDYSRINELYDALPYDKDEECSEKEYVGVWLYWIYEPRYSDITKHELEITNTSERFIETTKY